MGEKWEKVLSRAIGVNGIHINSALVSAQNRKRIYWTNIGMKPSGLFGDLESIIQQPKDKGILLKDILEKEVDEKYFLSEKLIAGFERHKERHNDKGTGFGYKPKNDDDKGNSLRANAALCPTDNSVIVHNTMPRSSTTGKGGTGHLSRADGKTYCLDTGNTNAVEIKLTSKDKRLQKIVDDNTFIEGEIAHLDTYNQTIDKDKSPTLTITNDSNSPSGKALTSINNRIRRLTPTECERLQTVKDNEISCIFALCLEKAKNYVNVVSQNPRLLKLVLDAENSELNELVKNALLNMSVNHQSIKHTVPQNADMQIQKGTNQCTNHNQQGSNTNANNAELNVMSNCQREWVDFAQPNVFINIIEGRITHFGLEELHQKDNHSTNQLNGSMPLKLYGNEIMELAKGAIAETTKWKGTNFTYITLYRSNTKSLEQMLIIYYLFAKNAIIGYTQNTTQTKSLLLNFNLKDGYTSVASDSQRYKMLGNGWTVDVIVHFFNYLKSEINE
jgi:site-specific DNA-cytosine methylase